MSKRVTSQKEPSIPDVSPDLQFIEEPYYRENGVITLPQFIRAHTHEMVACLDDMTQSHNEPRRMFLDNVMTMFEIEASVFHKSHHTGSHAHDTVLCNPCTNYRQDNDYDCEDHTVEHTFYLVEHTMSSGDPIVTCSGMRPSQISNELHYPYPRRVEQLDGNKLRHTSELPRCCRKMFFGRTSRGTLPREYVVEAADRLHTIHRRTTLFHKQDWHCAYDNMYYLKRT